MTVTLVRPAPVRLPGFGPGALVRVRPAPALDPPYDDEPDRPPTDPYEGGPATPGPDAPPPPTAREPSEAHRVVRRYLDACLEVLGGFRPLAHLRPLTEAGRFEEVAAQLARLGRLGGSAVTRPGSGLVRVGADRPRLRHLRVCEIRNGVVEAAAVLGRGEQVRALTLRLEQRAGAWLCTHLEVL
jgi:uncharacterized protein DUF6459